MARIWMTHRHGFHPASSAHQMLSPGRSVAPYDSLNLGLKVGDDRDAVLANRSGLASACGLDRIIFMDQIHSAVMLEANDGGEQLCDGIFLLRGREESERIGLAVQVADCVPLLLTHPDFIAAVHIGREGLVKGMTESAIGRLEAFMDLKSAEAWIGPSICGDCYQVSEELLKECGSAYPKCVHSISDRKIDVAQGVISVLESKEIQWSWFGGERECVSCDASYFSYRRDGVTGRQAMIVAW